MAVNGKSYHLNPNTALFGVEDDDDDVDDELFLKNSRKPQSQLGQLQERKQNVENNTLASTQRSLALLQESEQVGIQTANELATQREKLERTSHNLDSINATLRTTQRNIDGIKSVFSSFKNYLTRPKDTNLPTAKSNLDGPHQPPSEDSWTAVPSTTGYRTHQQTSTTSQQQASAPRTAQQAIENNLDLMADNIGNLKGLALNLGDEILEQNELLDSMQYKADRADVTIHKQNTQINRLLGKK